MITEDMILERLINSCQQKSIPKSMIKHAKRIWKEQLDKYTFVDNLMSIRLGTMIRIVSLDYKYMSACMCIVKIQFNDGILNYYVGKILKYNKLIKIYPNKYMIFKLNRNNTADIVMDNFYKMISNGKIQETDLDDYTSSNSNTDDILEYTD